MTTSESVTIDLDGQSIEIVTGYRVGSVTILSRPTLPETDAP